MRPGERICRARGMCLYEWIGISKASYRTPDRRRGCLVRSSPTRTAWSGASGVVSGVGRGARRGGQHGETGPVARRKRRVGSRGMDSLSGGRRDEESRHRSGYVSGNRLTGRAAGTIESAVRRMGRRRGSVGGVVWTRASRNGTDRRHGWWAGGVRRAGEAVEALRSPVVVVVVVMLLLLLRWWWWLLVMESVSVLLSVVGEICAGGHAPQLVARRDGRRGSRRGRRRGRRRRGRRVDVGGVGSGGVDGVDGAEVHRTRGVVGGGRKR